MSTIEERLEHICQKAYEDYDDGWLPQREEIAAGWNAAVEAMENAAKFLDALSDAADSNYGTDGKLDDFINAHMSDLDENTAKPLWAALAAMEGNNAEDN